MIVKLRHESKAEGHVLGDVPIKDTNIDAVFYLLRAWGLSYEGDLLDVEGADAPCGQFVLDDGGAYFEIIFPDN